MPAQTFRVFVVEDNEWYNKLLVHSISLNPDYEVETFMDGKSFLAALAKKKPNVVTLDYRLPDASGSEILKKIKALDEKIEVIIISEQEDLETAVELLKIGAFDYIPKSKDIRERLLNTINNIRKQNKLLKEVSLLQKEVQQKYEFQNAIVGNSTAIKNVFTLMEKAAGSNITVSVTGETGTGKEVVAKAIHFNSSKKDKPFVAVNMAAVPRELMESELFGHEKGAFTGALTRRIGRFEEASGGTLFLDEIGELELSLQAKLLRVLQEKEVSPVGSNQRIKTDCRIIVATHKNLRDEVKKGSFREDLFFRLYGLTIHLPPLRDRDKDILVLAKHFIEKYSLENQVAQKKLSADAQRKLLSYSFPGNVRELKSVIELGIVMASTDEIGADDTLISVEEQLPELISGDLTLREYNHRLITTYLKKFDQNINLVAHKLDISPSTIYRMLKEFEHGEH